MMMKFFLFTILLFFIACSSDPKNSGDSTNTKDSVASVKEDFQTGVVLDKLICKTDTTQSYALYLPKNYSSQKQYPVMYAFDAHATGKLPVSLYAELSEKYGFILIGSNNSENGIPFETSKSIANRMFADSKERLSIDPKRIYLLGFSGGARVANAITMGNPSIAGVICCGAALPAGGENSVRNDYTFLGIAGNADLNYTEMTKYQLLGLSDKQVKRNFISFEGEHTWPPVMVMDEAFLWTRLNEMRKGVAGKSATYIVAQLLPLQSELNSLLKAEKQFEAYKVCRKAINYYEGLADLSYFYEAYKKLKVNQDVSQHLKKEEITIQREEKLRQEYMMALQTKEYGWWTKDIAALQQKSRNKKDADEGLIYKRTLNFLSLVLNMQTKEQLKQNNIAGAEHFGKLYLLVDPDNKDAHDLMTEISARKKAG